MTTQDEAIRAKFESHESARNSDLSRHFGFDSPGEYANPAVENRWQGWCAALATIQPAAAQEPVAWRFREYDDQEKAHSTVWQITQNRADMELYRHYGAIIEPLTPPAAHTDQPTDISERLRERARGGYTAVHVDDGALMLKAADEIERCYGGMLAWKKTAEKKDRDWNEERMGRVNDRIAHRAAHTDTPPAVAACVDAALPEPVMYITSGKGLIWNGKTTPVFSYEQMTTYGAQQREAGRREASNVPGLGRITDEDNGVVTLEFKDEDSAQAFMHAYHPTVECTEMPDRATKPAEGLTGEQRKALILAAATQAKKGNAP